MKTTSSLLILFRYIRREGFVILLFFLLSACKPNSSETINSSEESRLNDSISKMKERLYSVEDIITYTYYNSDLGISIPDDCVFLDSDSNQLKKQHLSSKYRLFISLPNNACMRCVHQLLALLQSNHLEEQTAILCNNLPSLTRLKDQSVQECSSDKFLLVKGTLNLPVEKENVIFLFTISQEGCIQNVFVPDVELEFLTERYLDVMGDKFNGKNTMF